MPESGRPAQPAGRQRGSDDRRASDRRRVGPATRRAKRTLVSCALALALAAGVSVVYLLEDVTQVNPFAYAEAKLVDLRFRLRGPRVPSGEVAVVVVDTPSVAALGRWPWPRSLHARLIDRLREWGASTVAFDVLFIEAHGQLEAQRLRRIEQALPAAAEAARAEIAGALSEVLADELFAAAQQRAIEDDTALTVLAFDFILPEDVERTRLLGEALGPAQEQTLLDFASFLSRDQNVPYLRRRSPYLGLGIQPVITGLAEWSAALGFVDPELDVDSVIRRERLLMAYGPGVKQARLEGRDLEEVFSDPGQRMLAAMPLAVAAVQTHLRLTVDQMVLDLEASELRFPAADGSERVVAFDGEDGTMPIDFYGGSGHIPTYSYADVLSGELTDAGGRPLSGADALGGKLVFVGVSDPGNVRDLFVTPFTTNYPGVEKHATVADNLLSGRLLRRPRDPELAVLLSAFVAAMVSALLISNLPSVWALLAGIAIAGGWLVMTYRDFVFGGVLWNWTVPLVTMVASGGLVMVYRQLTEQRARRRMEEKSEFLQRTFGRYVSAEVATMLITSPENLRLGGQRRTVTILMTDLRGFTALCERSEPEVVVRMLNSYLGAMADAVLEYQGIVDSFIGDAVMAVFGSPLTRDGDSARAVACAIEMQRALVAVNETFREEDLPELEMGVGINTGEVVAGNLGSVRRSHFGVVGACVNVAARIESYTVGGQVLVSGATLAAAGDLVEVGDPIEIAGKGLQRPVLAYPVISIGSPFDLEVPVVKENVIELVELIEVRFVVISGKKVGNDELPGHLVRLSNLGAEIACETPLDPLTNLKMTILDFAGEPLDGDVYAKVLTGDAGRPAESPEKAPTPSYPLRFTWTPPAIKKHLKKIHADAVDLASRDQPHSRLAGTFEVPIPKDMRRPRTTG